VIFTDAGKELLAAVPSPGAPDEEPAHPSSKTSTTTTKKESATFGLPRLRISTPKQNRSCLAVHHYAPGHSIPPASSKYGLFIP
jgi:hypothetical protein